MGRQQKTRTAPASSKARRGRKDRNLPASPQVREEYPGPQETSTGERIDPGSTQPRPLTPDERRGGRRRGSS
jgi:hypothetical protein